MRYDTVSFTNITEEEFQAKYDGEVYSVQPGETKVYPDFLGKHMTKHLVDRVILNSDSQRLNDKDLRAEYAEQILGSVVSAPEEEDSGEALKEEVEQLQEEPEEEEEEEEAFSNVPEEIEERDEIREEALSEMSKGELIDKAKKAGVYKEDMNKDKLVEAVKDL